MRRKGMAFWLRSLADVEESSGDGMAVREEEPYIQRPSNIPC
jgi:hypothetical protein